MTDEAHSLLRRLIDPKVVVLCVCAGNFISMVAQVIKLERDFNPGLNDYIGGWTPTVLLVEPMILLVAAVCLLINRWWTLLIALLASGRIIYTLGYLSWRESHFAQGRPTWNAFEKLWYVVYQPRPQYLLEVIVALVIFAYSVALLFRFLRPRHRVALAGG